MSKHDDTIAPLIDKVHRAKADFHAAVASGNDPLAAWKRWVAEDANAREHVGKLADAEDAKARAQDELHSKLRHEGAQEMTAFAYLARTQKSYSEAREREWTAEAQRFCRDIGADDVEINGYQDFRAIPLPPPRQRFNHMMLVQAPRSYTVELNASLEALSRN